MRSCRKILQSRTCHRSQHGACPLHAGYLRLQIHTHNIYNAHCFSTATAVIRPRLIHVHCWSCISTSVNIYKRHDASSVVQGGSNMTGTDCGLFTHKQSRSYLNHLVFQLTICDNRTGINCLVSIITFRMLTKEIPSVADEASSWNMWWTFDKLTCNKLLLLMSCLDLFNICVAHGCGIPLTILSHHAMHQQTPAFHRHQTYETTFSASHTDFAVKCVWAHQAASRHNNPIDPQTFTDHKIHTSRALIS